MRGPDVRPHPTLAAGPSRPGEYVVDAGRRPPREVRVPEPEAGAREGVGVAAPRFGVDRALLGRVEIPGDDERVPAVGEPGTGRLRLRPADSAVRLELLRHAAPRADQLFEPLR